MAIRTRKTRRVVRRRPPAPAPLGPTTIAIAGLVLVVVLPCCCIFRSCSNRNAEASESEPASDRRGLATIDLNRVESEPSAALRLRNLAPEATLVTATADQLAHLPSIKAIRVVTYVPDSGAPARGGGVSIVAGEQAGLAVLLQCAKPGDADTNIYFSDAPAAKWGDTEIPTDRLSAWPVDECGPLNIRWYKIEPAKEQYNNGAGDSFAFAKIEYVRTRVPEWDNKWYVPVDVAPLVHPDRLPGYGTMRYQVEVFPTTAAGEKGPVVASVGLEQAKKPQGISTSVPRVSVRKDNTYVGYLYAWGNVPYVYGSESPTGTSSGHQAELFQGSDCCDTLVAAARAFGSQIGYSYTGGLGKIAKTLTESAKAEADGTIAVDGKPVPWGTGGVQRGDVLVLGRDLGHCAALLEDRGVEGVLDTGDLVFHHLHSAPTEETLGNAWECSEVRIYRFEFGG